MNDDTSLIGFNAICQFVKDLAEEFGKKHKPLRLYNRLIGQTKISYTDVIKKHIIIFHGFCTLNRDALTTKDESKLLQKKIEYSDRVYIDMGYIFHIADTDNKSVIWQHLLTISAIIDPAGKAKDILRKSVEENKDTPAESNFLSDIISKVEKNVNPTSNPNEAISSILQSGIVNDLIGGMQSGKLDLGRLLGAVQGMMGNLSANAGDDPETKQAMGMLNNVMGSMNSSNPPDLSGMMTMMSSLLGGMNGPVAVPDSKPKIEDITDKQK